jgi:peroxiredoxin
MEIFLLFARLLLAGVFGVAGIAKAADLDGSRRAIAGFGIPEKLAAPLGLGLPVAEILIALALIPLSSAWVGAIAALAVLLIFSIGIAVNLARGKAPDCHCFGQLHSEPVGWSTFARNVVLIGVAGLIVVQGKESAGLSALTWLAGLKVGEMVSLVLSVAAVAMLAVTFVYLRRVLTSQETLLDRIDAMKKVIDEDYAEAPVERAEAAKPAEGLPIGAPAPQFSLAAVGGEQVTLSDLLGYGKPVLLLFVSPSCVPCKTLLPGVKDWERDYSNQLTVALLSAGDATANKKWLEEIGARHVLLQGESGIMEEYGAKWTPAAVVVRSDGKIASPVSYGDEDIRALVSRAVSPVDAPRKRELEIMGNGNKPQVIIGTPQALRDLGKPAPKFSLPDIEGKMINAADLLGRDTLMIFWDPRCPYCQGMSEDIINWEANPPNGAPELMFVCSGEEDACKVDSERFKSPFLYDRKLESGLLFGTNLTPSAVLIDAEGKIASPPTAGGAIIMALAGARKSLAPVGASV